MLEPAAAADQLLSEGRRCPSPLVEKLRGCLSSQLADHRLLQRFDSRPLQ